ncbi:MAG: hypothetical protein JRF02_00150 [Deltaproteobacteria bacterium]|jgi:hypothetical protein|nr:hypothetical protein [Deltaproteobacteria bacterium]
MIGAIQFNKVTFQKLTDFRTTGLIGLCNCVFLFSLAVCLCSCSTTSLLPSQKNIVITPWKSFKEAETAFEKITPYQTQKTELEKIGFAPRATSNFTVLNYLDIMERFMPNQSITKEDLAAGLQDCLADQEQCYAYEINIRKFKSQRFGNVFLDLFNFRRKTKVRGWEFNALIVLKDGLVVYKLSSGAPMTDELHDSKNPLGPLQSADKFIWAVSQ